MRPIPWTGFMRLNLISRAFGEIANPTCQISRAIATTAQKPPTGSQPST